MTDDQIEKRLGVIISEMAQISDSRKIYLRELLDKRRTASVAIASGNKSMLKNETVKTALDGISKTKRTIEMVNYLTEMEIGEIAFIDAVKEESLKILEKEVEALKNLIVHVSSVRKAERI